MKRLLLYKAEKLNPQLYSWKRLQNEALGSTVKVLFKAERILEWKMCTGLVMAARFHEERESWAKDI